MEEVIRDQAQESEFNAAIATLMRIDEIKKCLDVSTIKENPFTLYRHLKAYYKELESSFNPEDSKFQSGRFRNITIKYSLMKTALLQKRKSIPNYMTSFDLWELELRRLEQKYGMNLPKKKDARWALARR